MKRGLAVLAVATVVLAAPGVASAANANDWVFPPGSSPGGSTYSEWAGAYQIWFESIPVGRNPFVDPTSDENCARQPGGVVFVGPAGGECWLGEHQKLAIAPNFWECSTAEGLGDTWAELRACARDNFARDFDPSIFGTTVKIDGLKVRHPRRWVFETPGEIIHFPVNNLWGAPAGDTKSVTKGFFYILRPLGPGDHHLRIHVRIEGVTSFNIDTWLHVSD